MMLGWIWFYVQVVPPLAIIYISGFLFLVFPLFVGACLGVLILWKLEVFHLVTVGVTFGFYLATGMRRER